MLFHINKHTMHLPCILVLQRRYTTLLSDINWQEYWILTEQLIKPTVTTDKRKKYIIRMGETLRITDRSELKWRRAPCEFKTQEQLWWKLSTVYVYTHTHTYACMHEYIYLVLLPLETKIDHLNFQAISFSNLYAPEHLIINVKDAEKWENFIENAGTIWSGLIVYLSGCSFSIVFTIIIIIFSAVIAINHHVIFPLLFRGCFPFNIFFSSS